MDTEKLPYWPAALNRKLAAAYCGLSTETFGKICPIKPISLTGSSRGDRYLRQRLDEWLVSLDPNEPAAESIKQSLSWQSDRESRSSWVELEYGAPEPAKGAGGYPIVDDKNNPVRQWYDQLGFDPRTMGQDDMKRLMDENHQKWAAALIGTPLGKRERVALSQLAAHLPNQPIPGAAIKNCGPDTGDRLEARGFLEIHSVPDDPRRLSHYVLTDEGLKAWQKLQDEA
ncbi:MULTISPECIES: helix-turn-helix domain-containing protein [unclassified Rhizobium]|uniref:hypothetical protein n=1 Tax=unclassified Rhizobium TaxID=2613769 RepID=UPI001ADA56CB|nr:MULTISPECIES: hypothetical protein [unclassified Rhizobium]MBO9122812.1 hypothetical protein [Rhizobium sp. 16-488-2b]MBO9173344.1 hypothetical protein [Rhizobium sp. 16-488-2a]